MKQTNLETLRAATDAAHAAEIEGLERRLLYLRGQDQSLANFGEFHAKHFGASKRGRPSGGKNKAKIAAAKPASDGKVKKAKITPEQLASRQLQGKHISLVRQFVGEKKAAFQALAKEKGRKVAIAAMREELK